MTDREVLHQPPSAHDMAKFPPQDSRCARIRSLLRDFADGELGEVLRRSVEEHAHQCRTCALALARAEHEVMCLRRALGTQVQAAPPGDFTRETVKAVLQSLAEESSVHHKPVTRPSSRMLLGMLAAAALLVICASAFMTVVAAGSFAPSLTVMSATGVIDGASGEGIGVGRVLPAGARVRGGRGAAFEHNDPPRHQPSGWLRMTEPGELALQPERIDWVAGDLEVTSYGDELRLSAADGASLRLRAGAYRLADLGRQAGDASAGRGVVYELEVFSGDGAVITLPDGRTGVAGARQIARWGDGSGIEMIDPPPAGTPSSRSTDDPTATAGQVHLAGQVCIDNIGQAASELTLELQWLTDDRLQQASVTTDRYGRFEIPLREAPARDFVFARFWPASGSGLGWVPRHPVRLARQGNNFYCAEPILIHRTPEVLLACEGRDGNPLGDAEVVPLLVDECTGTVEPWCFPVMRSDGSGSIRLAGLPRSAGALRHVAVLGSASGHGTRTTHVPLGVEGLGGPHTIALEPTRAIRLTATAPGSGSQQLQVLREVAGLPPGAAFVAAPVEMDGQGAVWIEYDATVRHWLRYHAQGEWHIASLRVEGIAGAEQAFLVEAPAGERHLLEGLTPLGGTSWWLRIGNRYDLQLGAGATHEFQAFLGGRRIDGCEVFHFGQEHSLRFLGLTGTAAFVADLTVGDQLLVLDAQGSSALATVSETGKHNFELELAGWFQLGRALLEVCGERAMIACEPASPQSGPLRSAAVRLASPVTGWRLGPLPPGTYVMRFPNGLVTTATLAAGAVVELH